MKKFFKMAQSLTKSGDDFIQKKGIKQFHLKATELLNQATLAQEYNYQELVLEAFSDKFNKNQNYRFLEFSDLPLTIARGENCFIDIYFWRRRPTVIHNHHFNGAFQCLDGVNVDSEFEFIEDRKLGLYHSLGKINLINTRQLKKGDVATIDYLDKFIHQNHHQAEITVNLCFRTLQQSKKSLSNYLYSGLRYEKNSLLLEKVDRLISFCNLEDFDFKKIKLTHDDAINFLIQTQGSSVRHKRILELQTLLSKRLKDELGLNLTQLLQKHDKQLDKIQELYN